VRGLSVPEVQAYLSDGAEVVDVRPVSDYAAGHIPGSLAIPLRPVFATWLGWMADPDQSLVIVRNADQPLDEVIWQAHKVGYDRLVGELVGGMSAWASGGLEVRVTPLVDPGAVDPSSVIDVRQRSEYAGGHLPGARNLELGQIADAPIRMDAAVVMCGHGERAVSAASLLERAGGPPVSVLTGGPHDWARRTGRSIEVSR
jgi:rhodanese-related sulfurtransferase